MRSHLSGLKYAVLWVVMLALGLGLPTRAAAYSFTLIADSSSHYSFFVAPTAPSINAGGTVAFLSLLDAGGQGIFTGSGAVPNVTTTIANTSGPFNRFSSPSINAGGVLALFAALDAGGQGIFTGTGAVPNVTTTIANTSGPFQHRLPPPLDQDRGYGGVSRDLGRGGLRHFYQHRRGAECHQHRCRRQQPVQRLWLHDLD